MKLCVGVSHFFDEFIVNGACITVLAGSDKWIRHVRVSADRQYFDRYNEHFHNSIETLILHSGVSIVNSLDNPLD